MAKKVPASLLDQYRTNQVAEWDVFVCGSAPIDLDGVRAFNPGDSVPASHVTRGVVREDQVIARDDTERLESLSEIPNKPDPRADLPGGASSQPVIESESAPTDLSGGDK